LFYKKVKIIFTKRFQFNAKYTIKQRFAKKRKFKSNLQIWRCFLTIQKKIFLKWQ
jgi:hypothetical protein